ncbi:hypothetical protein [Acinetobacter tandoii]
MSAKLGTLTLDLVTRIGNFVGPIKESEKQVKTSFASMQKDVLAYGAVAVSGAAAAGAAVFAMAKNYADAAQELKTFAAISNATTQEFQAMSAGAQSVDINPDKLADQLKDFNEKLGEFITIGSGGAVDFFEQIAIKTEGSAEGARKLALEMQNLSGPKALQLYVDKLEEAGVTQQQMSFYLESMASDTTNLIPLLKNGGEGFKFWADAAERYGLIMDESAIQKAAEFKVQLRLLDMQIEGAKNQFIQGLMPSLVSIGDAMTDATKETNLMVEAGEDLGGVFKGVAATGMGIYAVIKMLSNAIAGLSFDAINAKKNVDLASEGGTWADKLPGIRLAKSLITGATVANAPNSGISMAAEDNQKLAQDISNTINNLFGNTVNQATSAMAKLQQQTKGVTSGMDAWAKKQSEAAKGLAEQNRLLEQQERDRTQIIQTYSTDYENIMSAEKSELEVIRKSGFLAVDQAKYAELAKKRFEAERAEYFKSLNLELFQYQWTEQKKLEYAYQQDKEIAENDIKTSGVVKEARLKFLDEQYAIELRKAKWHALEMQQTMQDAIKGLSGDADNIFAKATMSPTDYAGWSLENDRDNAKASLKDQHVGVQQDIMSAPTDVYATDEDRYAALLQAHKEYRDGLAAIDVQYDQQVKDLAQSQYETQMNIWQDLLTRTGSIFGQVAEMVKNTAGESSAAYKAMFLVNQGISMAQAMINTEVAATKAMAEGGYIAGIPMATAIRALGYTSVGLIAAQTISGMAHNGIDNIPKEGTWLLDGGERVLNPQQNKDLTNYLANQSSGGGGDVSIQVYITDSGVNTSGANTQDQKQLGQLIGNTVRAVIRQEQRQGGLLAK